MVELLRNRRRSCLGGLALLLVAGRVGAHTLPVSYLHVVPDADYLHLEFTVNPFELNSFSELDTNKDGRLEPMELADRQDAVTRRILDCLKLRVGGKLVAAEVSGITPDVDSHHITLRAQYPVDARSAPLEIESTLGTITSGSHLTQVTYLLAGRRQLAQLDMQSAKVTFEPLGKAPAAVEPASSTGRTGAAFAVYLFLVIPCVALLLVMGWRHRRQSRQVHPALR
jgi:hypothetical protein